MVIAALGLAAALVQGQGPLVRAESLLVAGDTAGAIAALRAVPFKAATPSDTAMAATLALLWIGRDEARRGEAEFAKDRAKQLEDEIKRQPRWVVADATPKGAIGRILREAMAIEMFPYKMSWADSLDRPPTARQDSDTGAVWKRFGTRSRDLADQVDSLRAYGDTLGEAHTLLAGAVRNALAQYDLRRLIDFVRADVPEVTSLPLQCRRRTASIECAVREALIESSDAGLNGVARRSTGAHASLDRARKALTAALPDPWPFGAMALQTLAGAELLFGTDSSRRALTSTIARAHVDSVTAIRLTAMAWALGGRSDSANSVMERHRPAFASFDTLVGPLEGRLRESPAVVWRTAWPLYLQGYNERLVAHRARVIAAGLLPTLSSPLSRALSFAPPAALIRRGLPLRLELYGGSQFISYVSGRTQETILPAASGSDRALDLNLSLAASDPTHGQLVVTGFVPSAYDHLRDLPHQMMRYQRNRQAMADFFAQPPLPPDKSCGYQAGFFLLGNDLRLLRRGRDTLPAGQAPRMHYTTPVAPGAYVYSMEVLDTTCAVAARARYAFQVLLPEQGLAVSDVLLVEGAPTFDAARVSGGIPVVGRAGVEVSALEPLSLYWEVYGVTAAELQTGRLLVEMDAVDVRRGRVPVVQLGDVQQRAEGANADATVRYAANAPPGTGPIGMALSVKIPAVQGAVCQIHVTITDQVAHAKATGTGSFYVRWEPK
jgi:hypothetical protein